MLAGALKLLLGASLSMMLVARFGLSAALYLPETYGDGASSSATLASLRGPDGDSLPPPSPMASMPNYLPLAVRNWLRAWTTVRTVFIIIFEYSAAFSAAEKALEAAELEALQAKRRLENTSQLESPDPVSSLLSGGNIDSYDNTPELADESDDDHRAKNNGNSIGQGSGKHKAKSGGGLLQTGLADDDVTLVVGSPQHQHKQHQHQQPQQSGHSSGHPSHSEQTMQRAESLVERRRQQLADLHSRCAYRLLDLAQRQGGVYVKAAQHIVSMSHAVPPEYSRILSVLQDRAVPLPLEDVRRVIREELGGQDPEQLFRSFEPAPIAAASLAQVHKAVTRDGETVAVKVQYGYLRDITGMDIATVRALAKLVERLFPRFRLGWLADQFEEHMLKEMDFVLEGKSGERIRNLLRDRDDVYVPRVRWDLTANRVICTEFIDGCRITDVPKIEAMGLSPLKVFDAFARTFGEMVFSFGFLHCDPHPGNALVRPRPEPPLSDWRVVSAVQRTWRASLRGLGLSKPKEQVVLLDHGLYRELTPQFRVSFARLWRAMFARDDDALQVEATNLQLGEHWKVLPVILIFRMAGSKQAVSGSWTPEERAKFRKEFARTTLADAVDFLGKLPPDLVFVLKTLNLVRAVNRDLGGSTGRRLKIFFNTAVEGAHTPNQREDDPLGAVLQDAPYAPSSIVTLDLRPRPVPSLIQKVSMAMDMTILNIGFAIFETFMTSSGPFSNWAWPWNWGASSSANTSATASSSAVDDNDMQGQLEHAVSKI